MHLAGAVEAPTRAERLRRLNLAQTELGILARQTVADMRGEGHSWIAIGTAAGVPANTLTRQFERGWPLVLVDKDALTTTPGKDQNG